MARAREIKEVARADAAEDLYRRTFERAASGLAHIGVDRKFIRVNRRLCEILGRSETELKTLTGRQISHPDDVDMINRRRPDLYEGRSETINIEKRYLKKSGETVWVSITIVLERDAAGRPQYEIAVFDDVTARKRAEEALRESEERFRQTFELAASGMAHVTLDGHFLRVNSALCQILGYSREELIGRSVKEVSHPEDRDATDADRSLVRRGELSKAEIEKRYLRKDGTAVWVDLAIALVRDAKGAPEYEIAILDDISARKALDAALRDKTELLQLGQAAARMIILDYDIRADRLTWSDSPEWLRGPLPADGNYPPFKEQVHPEDRERFILARTAAIDTLQPGSQEYRVVRTDGHVLWVLARHQMLADAGGRAHRMLVALIDITERKRAEAALREAHEELQRSNSELEQFAYVASHDLQEPLRMVSSYTQLLLRRFGERFDGDSREFMGYIVDGAARMKQLIEDLLAYSRVGTRGKEFHEVEVEEAVRRAVANLRAAIDEAGAAVTWDPLPAVLADELQLTQLFQNLVGNALKFRSASVPRISVQAKEHESGWHFTVADNGIGIEPQYFERIFMVFQRLHNKADYPGTGIGLAICKKVVERHGGRIWVESRPGEGSAFHFTLPKQSQEVRHD